MALRGIGAGLENLGGSLTVFSREQMERDAAARAAAQAQAATAVEAEKQRTFQGLLQREQQAGAEKLQGLQDASAENRLTMANVFQKAQEQRERTDKALAELASLPTPEKQAARIRAIELADPVTYKLLTPRVQTDLLNASARVTDQSAALSIAERAGADLAKRWKTAQDEYDTAVGALTVLDKQLASIPDAELKAERMRSPEYLAARKLVADSIAKQNALQPEINSNRELQGSLSGSNPDRRRISEMLQQPTPGKPSAPTGEEAPMTSAANADLLAQLVDKGQQAKAAQNLSRPEMEKLLKASEAGKQLSPAQIQLVLDQIYPSR